MSDLNTVFYEYVSQFLVENRGFLPDNNRTIQYINDTMTTVFASDEENGVVLGVQCGDKQGCDKITAVLNGKHFDKWFSELKIDTEKNLLYKTYFITEDVRVKPTEMIYLFNCISELNIKLK
ncbi:hypothetical protein FACS1894109_12290 [Spirochaetia bacterium]|nr:hypothetical protein FACS1894109_12290 [Spirochaetia bacterium]